MRARAMVGVATQGLWSGLSFLVAILLARFMTLEEFGWYAIAVTIKQLFIMVLGALVLTPLTIFSGQTERSGSNAARTSVAVVLRVVALAALAIGVALQFTLNLPAAELAVFVVGGVAVEFQRRLNFIDERIREDLIGGVANMVLIVAGILLAHGRGYLFLNAVFMTIGGVNLLWVIVSGWKLWSRSRAPVAWNEMAEMWKLGRWGLASNFTGYVYSQLNVFLTLPLVGPSGVGILELGRQIVTFVQVLMLGMSNVWHPRLAGSAARDHPRAFLKLVWHTARLQTAIGGVMLFVMLMAMPSFLPVFFPDKQDAFPLAVPIAWILAGGMICQLLWQHPSFAAIALGKPQYGFVSRLVTSLLLVPAGFALTYRYGVIGAAWTRAIGELLVLVFSIAMLYRAVEACDGRAASLVTSRGS